MDIKWLKTFTVAAKHENFRQASEELFLTQPAITKHIRRLEEYLNIELFNRMGKTVTLTPAGYKFLPYAKEILYKYNQRIEEFELWKQGYNQTLTIATAPQIASSILPTLLRKFMDENPHIEVTINVVKSFEVSQEISLGRADLGLTRKMPIQMNVKSEVVHEEPVILVGSWDHHNHLTDEEKTILQRYRVITYNHPEYWKELLTNIKRLYPTVRTMVVNQVEITKRIIEEGLGVSYLPMTMVKDELEMKKLIKINSEHIIPPSSKTYLVTKVETPEVRTFIQFLRAAIADI